MFPDALLDRFAAPIRALPDRKRALTWRLIRIVLALLAGASLALAVIGRVLELRPDALDGRKLSFATLGGAALHLPGLATVLGLGLMPLAITAQDAPPAPKSPEAPAAEAAPAAPAAAPAKKS